MQSSLIQEFNPRDAQRDEMAQTRQYLPLDRNCREIRVLNVQPHLHDTGYDNPVSCTMRLVSLLGVTRPRSETISLVSNTAAKTPASLFLEAIEYSLPGNLWECPGLRNATYIACIAAVGGASKETLRDGYPSDILWHCQPDLTPASHGIMVTEFSTYCDRLLPVE
ncbi:MAG: hypothetical protein LQ340_001866 [Diploschistes diacapsis]|nr:MAG: hypothetical protein LQ340_001866 [Diploschistes diacapsis]